MEFVVNLVAGAFLALILMLTPIPRLPQLYLMWVSAANREGDFFKSAFVATFGLAFPALTLAFYLVPFFYNPAAWVVLWVATFFLWERFSKDGGY